MAFYKLFYIIHRRTDWDKLLSFEREHMMPEWYAERDRRRAEALSRLMLPFAVVDRCLGSKGGYF